MLTSIDLNGMWRIRGFDGQHGVPEAFCGDDCDHRTFIDAAVPGDVHLDLERAGWIPDCNVGLHAQSARWVEEQVWVYRTTFNAPSEALQQHAWLVFEGLDLNAVIYLNGQEIGRHANAFTPCRLDVTGRLRSCQNALAVRIESGLYSVSEKPGMGYNTALDHHLHKRSWLRKPQYSFSWDWNPRLVNVGIWKPVRLEWTDSPRIDCVAVYPDLSDDRAHATINVRTFVENASADATRARIRIKIPECKGSVESEVELPAGNSRHDLSVDIENPRLWWPRPHGDHPLYTVICELLVGPEVVDTSRRRTGIRTVRINQDAHPEEGRHFILEVNGRPIFAKGGNWVPPDMIYARPDAARYRRLVELAVGANFNALRIWGGGLYADHTLLDACDEMGILVWHDFIFACSKYPGDDPEFLNSVRREVTYQVRDLSPHPSLVVWCGNNELEWGAWGWGYDQIKPHPDYALYHMEIPRIVKQEDPSRPYWASSPYSPDHCHPCDVTTGDQHPWHVSLGENGPNFWAYRTDVSRFPNEGGVLGASSPATLREFLPEDQRYVFSPAWEFHDNACNYWGQPGIVYRYLDHWLGWKPDDLDFDDYVFYSGLLQSEGLQEYINNFRRRMFSTSSAIFWMYNDSWPASHGWTIVDYYLRRKLAYHPVRRAFAPVHVIPVIDGNRVTIFGVNDTPAAWHGDARYGVFRLSGGFPRDEVVPAVLRPNAATVIEKFPLSELESQGAGNVGVFGLLTQDGMTVAQSRVFSAKFRDLKFAPADIRVQRKGDNAVFTSSTFVWGVCLDMDGEIMLSDDVFDLLPGIEYEMPWRSDYPLPKVQRCGSPLLTG